MQEKYKYIRVYSHIYTWTQVRGYCNNQCEKYLCSYLTAIAVDTEKTCAGFKCFEEATLIAFKRLEVRLRERQKLMSTSTFLNLVIE